MSRETRLVGLEAVLEFFSAAPTAAQQEMVVELAIVGRELLDAQHHDVAKDTGALDAALSMQVIADQLKVRVGLLRGTRAARTFNGRKSKARAGGPFYGRIVENGRHAQTVLVTRRVKKRRVTGNFTSDRKVTYLGATKRKRPASSPNAGTFVGDPYKLRVRARAAHPFIAQPVLMEAADLHLSDFWAAALTAWEADMAMDLLSATSDGVFALLDAAIGADIAEVTTNPTPIDPKDTSERQFVLIGDIDSVNEGGKGEQLERLTVQVVVVYRGRQRSKLHALMHRVHDALEYATPAAPGVDFGELAWTGSAASPPGRDGVTHAGAVEFEIFAEPA